MSDSIAIPVTYSPDETINGLGSMIGQYLEQNLRDSEKKRRQAQRLNFCTSVEVEKGISTTIRFQGTAIQLENGIASDTDLHLKGSYLHLADLMTGRLNPISAILGKKISLFKLPLSKPFQLLRLFRFLKIPGELVVDTSDV